MIISSASIVRMTLLVLFTFTIASWSNAGYIHLKAELAQIMMEIAWQKTLNGEANAKPWPWADTWPVARLKSLDDDLLVLAGTYGSALAFGPGHMNGTSLPGRVGTSVIAGHRDTHFRFLQVLTPGDSISLQDLSGSWHAYQVHSTSVVDTKANPDWQLDLSRDEIHLVTCYPFDAILTGGPLRFIVKLVRDSQ